jgi:hypothetical protein
LFSAWIAGEWCGLLVAGEPGIGKTRFVSELAHRVHVDGCTVVIGRCDEEITIGYRPWADALVALFEGIGPGQLAGLPPDHVEELRQLMTSIGQRDAGPAARPAVDSDTRQAMIADAVIELLQAVGPLAIVLDDVHWIDRRSLQLVRAVLAAAASGALPHVAIIGTFRDTDLDDDHPLTAALADFRRMNGIRRVALGGLDASAVVALVQESVVDSLDDRGMALAAAVHARTAGNPLFVGELLRDMANRSATGDEGLPAGLRELIGRRLHDLGPAVTHTLQVAAVVGLDFDVDAVEQAIALGGANGSGTDTDDPLAHLERAQAAGIIGEWAGERLDGSVGHAMYHFRHEVIREVLLGQLSTPRRQRLHRDLAAVLERRWGTTDALLEAIAFHHGQGRTAQASAWYLKLAEAAAASLDDAAVGFANLGLELLDAADPADPSTRQICCDLLIAKAGGVRLTGAETITDARAALNAAVELGDTTRIGKALQAISLAPVTMAESEHNRFLTEGLTFLHGCDDVWRWNAEVALAVRQSMDPYGDPDEHVADVQRIVAHLDPADPMACQIAMRCARSLTSAGKPRPALEIAERFVANCGGLDTERFPVAMGLSTMWLHLGDRDRSRQLLEEGAADPRRSYWFYDCIVMHAMAAHQMLDGEWGEAEATIAEIQRVGGHDLNVTLAAESQLGWLRRERGDYDTNLAVTRGYVDSLPEFPVLRALLIAELAEAGQDGEARHELEAAAAHDFAAVGGGWLTVMAIGNLAWAAVTLDATAHAEELRRRLVAYGGQQAVMATGTHVMCAVDRLLAGLSALMGDDDEADRLFAGALAQERALLSKPLEARTLHWWGRALQRRGDGERSRELLGRSRELASGLAMPGLVRQIDGDR